MTEERDRIRRKQHAARLRQAERARQAEAEKRQAALNLPPPGPERTAELERRHAQARDSEPEISLQADDRRRAQRAEQELLRRQAELDELFPPRHCHFCSQPAPFGFGPPGWSKKFYSCLAHRPPRVLYDEEVPGFWERYKKAGGKTGADFMAQLLQQIKQT